MTEQLKTLYSVTGDIKDINTLLVPREKMIAPSGDSLEDFAEGQWWLKELDAMVANGTPDQKRAVAVVRNLMATVKAQQPQADASRMADRLMAWKLPADFNPDGGISFDRTGKNHAGYPHEWPIGTNLLTHEQAKAMFEYVLEGVQQPHLTELQKDAVPLLFALREAWTYVHGHCTIKSRKDEIQRLIVKHGDFAEVWKNDKTVQQQAEAVPPGFKLLKDTTHDERSWPEDAKSENGSYYNTCLVCIRQFIGHKRRPVCRVCDASLTQQKGAGHDHQL